MKNKPKDPMDERPREEFVALRDFSEALKYNFINCVVMRAEHLIKIRDLIEHCHYIAEGTAEKDIVSKTVYYWRKCLYSRPQYAYSADQTVIEDIDLPQQEYSEPKSTALVKANRDKKEPKTFEEMLTEKDKRFLELFEKGIPEKNDNNT